MNVLIACLVLSGVAATRGAVHEYRATVVAIMGVTSEEPFSLSVTGHVDTVVDANTGKVIRHTVIQEYGGSASAVQAVGRGEDARSARLKGLSDMAWMADSRIVAGAKPAGFRTISGIRCVHLVGNGDLFGLTTRIELWRPLDKTINLALGPLEMQQYTKTPDGWQLGMAMRVADVRRVR